MYHEMAIAIHYPQILMTVSLVCPTALLMPAVLTNLEVLDVNVSKDTQGMVSITALVRSIGLDYDAQHMIGVCVLQQILTSVKWDSINVNTNAMTLKGRTCVCVILVLL